MQPELIDTGALQRDHRGGAVRRQRVAVDRPAGEADRRDPRRDRRRRWPRSRASTPSAGSCCARSPAATGSRALRPRAGVVEAYLLPARTNLSPAAMETLAIVAYLQPVTKTEIEALRGVNVDGGHRDLDRPGLHRRGRAQGRRRATDAVPHDAAVLRIVRTALALRVPALDFEGDASALLPLPLAERLRQRVKEKR